MTERVEVVPARPAATSLSVGRDTHALIRHPGDVLRVALGATVSAVSALLAAARRVSGFETDVFRLINRLPGVFEPPLWAVMQLGSLAAVPAAAGVALLARRRRLAADLVFGGVTAYVAAKVVKA
ncbi:MAG: TIGR00374 family protein, partial [Egibacteraceae bacterium]